ncbi:MAG: Gldg family protein [Planctomycetota bacterium]|nr:Gldg family protein [Planctomycetota bacterium]
MALEKPKGARQSAGEASGEPQSGMAQKRRWLVFGSNVVVAVLLATALVVAAVWLSDVLLKGRGRSDWTATGRFSLSPRTKALLGDLKEDITLTNLYVKSPEMPESLEQQARVQDLLQEYGAVNPSRVTVDEVDPLTDAGGTEKLVGRLRQRYAKELEKPKALLEEFTPLNKDISTFLDDEAKQLEAAADAWKGGPPDIVQALRTVAQKWRQLQMLGDFTGSSIQSATEQALPAYTSAVSRAKEYLGSVTEMFAGVQDFFNKVQARGAGEPPEVKALLVEGKARYEKMGKRVEEFLKKAAEIKELELDSIRREISQGQVVLIEAPDKVKVVGYEDVWVRNPEADERHPDAPERLFAGESALSSALLGLVEPERPAVLFVTAGAMATASAAGNPMMGMGGNSGPYAHIAERLRKINLIVEDWDVLRSPEMPKPEHMTKMILVFVPPAPPSMQMPTPPPTPELYRAAIDAVKRGAPAVILGEPAGMMSPGVPYAELYGLFGVTPKFNAISVHRQVVDQQGTEKAVPQVEFSTYPDTPVTRALSGLPAIMLGPSPILINSPLPKGVTATAILLLPAEKDYWADTTPMDAMRGEAKRDEAEDIYSTREKPVALGVACTRDTEQGEQKAVLFGDAKWATDRVAFYRDPFGRDMFPGNAELLVNSVLWVAGTEHLITVSPETLQARRIGDPGSWTTPVQLLTWLGIPAAALLAGIIVYAVRRR